MKRITLLIAGILCCAACNNEIEIPEEPEEAGLQIQLFVPDTQEVSVYSAATVSECMIDTLLVCVFNKEDSTKRFIEMIEGNQIIHNGQARQLLPQLKQKINPGDIVICIANVASNPQITDVLHHDSINNCFPVKTTDPLHHYRGGDFLPMYGEIKSWSPAGAYTCRMTRAVAKIQVQLGSSFSTVVSDFNADNVTYQVHNITESNFIQPQPTPNKRFEKASDNDYQSTVGYLLQKKDTTERETDIFLHEFQSGRYTIVNQTIPIEKEKWDPQRTYIDLRKGSRANMKYYWLDFYDHTNSVYPDILRNHHYLFTINRVGSEGYKTHYKAHNFPGSNLEYTIYVNDGWQSITSNGQMAVVTSVDTVRIFGDVMDQAVTKFKYIDPPGVTINLDVRSTDTVVVESGLIQSGSATLTITSPTRTDWLENPMIKAIYQDLKITTTGNLEAAILLFKYGNITHRLPVRRRLPQSQSSQ